MVPELVTLASVTLGLPGARDLDGVREEEIGFEPLFIPARVLWVQSKSPFAVERDYCSLRVAGKGGTQQHGDEEVFAHSQSCFCFQAVGFPIFDFLIDYRRL